MATTLEQVLHGRDTISSKDAKVTVTIDGSVINLIDCKELKINIKKNKEKVQVLGDHWTKHKTTSVDGTGTLGQYVVNSNLYISLKLNKNVWNGGTFKSAI